MSIRSLVVMVSVLASALVATCCTRESNEERSIRFATTTSVENTGLLQALLAPFTERTGIKVHVVAVGTGQALTLARNGDADAVLVHDVDAELAFVKEGFGIHRVGVMHNDFVLLGPPEDPAGVKGLPPAQALAKIAASGSTFVSRGDESGTHRRELKLWQQAGVEPSGRWYIETGQGQRLTIQMADEKRGYCLTDRGTYVVAQSKVNLSLLVEGGEELLNPYHAMAVNPAVRPGVRYVESLALLGWLMSPEGQSMIGDFRQDGIQLFHPDSPSPESLSGAVP